MTISLNNRVEAYEVKSLKAVLIAPLLAVMFLFPTPATCTRAPQSTQAAQLRPDHQEAKDELNEAARAYREGKFAEAQQHSERALALDPSNKTAPLFIARTIHAQYKPGDRSETNIAKAHAAIAAYKQILVQDPQHEEAYKAVAYLYAALKENELLSQWVFQRATDPTVSDEKRAEAFVVLASSDWDCSFKITELPANKITTLADRAVDVHYTKPRDVAEFENARRCATNGLMLVEAAIALAPDNESAWSYKTNLLLELSKLAEMDNKLLLKADYERQSEAASKITFQLSKKRESKVTTQP